MRRDVESVIRRVLKAYVRAAVAIAEAFVREFIRRVRLALRVAEAAKAPRKGRRSSVAGKLVYVGGRGPAGRA